jgi:hypothetical protein
MMMRTAKCCAAFMGFGACILVLLGSLTGYKIKSKFYLTAATFKIA